MVSIAFHTCGTDCPAYGTTKGGVNACFFGYTGRSFQGAVVNGQACIHTVDRKLLRSLKGKLKLTEAKLEDVQIHRSDLRELVRDLEVVLSMKGT